MSTGRESFTERCPAPEVLARAVSQADSDPGDAAALQTHLRGCPGCQLAWRQQRELLALGARLPFVLPSAERRQQLRGELLAQVAGNLKRRRGPGPRVAAWAALLGGLAVAAMAGLWLRPRLTSPAPLAGLPAPPRVQIEAAADARYTQLAGPPHEVVRLYQGTVRFTVAPAKPGESFRVVTGAGEVEVRGTIFETTAIEDRLLAVRVERGRVVVRQESGKPELALEAGGSWQRPAAALVPPAELQPTEPPPLPAPAPRKTAAPRPGTPSGPRRARDPAEQALGEGLALLRASDPAAAAAAFERAITLSPRGTLAEDASYWQAVALTRAGEPGKGHDAFRVFLDRFPQSARAGEAAVMLGWLLLGRGDDQAASERFRAGLADPSARVRQSAQAGLDALASQRTGPR